MYPDSFITAILAQQKLHNYGRKVILKKKR